MDPIRWARIQTLFYAAADLAPEQRNEYLAAACGGDTQLQRQVESLIASSADDASFIGDAVNQVAAAATGLAPGVRIGAYEIVRELGQGGMGAVYLAIRADDLYRKNVAIKVMRLTGSDMLARFKAERQILANLDHPYIARLLDGGTTESGAPFVVMEFVDGIPIDRWLRERTPSLDARLKLFRQVCEAVSYAHRRLVVHRDIKPANLLVTADGTAKLLDFGIAKLLAAEPGSAILTQAADRLMTPDYASPEQVRGDTVTTATDVYLLGILLFEMLTGARPFRITSLRPTDIEKVICETEPELPSVEVSRPDRSPGGVTRRQLTGDLDNIVLMALRKEPARRYATVDQFAEDTRRHQEGFPILACKDTWRYRADKFVRRHRWGVAAATAFVVVVLGFAAGMALLARRVAEERDAARQERTTAEQVAQFLIESFRVADRSGQQGKTITAQEILNRGAGRIRGELASQPAVQSKLMDTMGEVYGSLGLYDRAQPLVEEALAKRRKVFGEVSREVAESYHTEAAIADARGDLKLSEASYRKEIQLQQRLRGPGSAQLAAAEAGLGALLSRRDQLPEAEKLLRDSLAIRTQLFGRESAEVADSLGRLGSFYHRQTQYAEAEPYYREGLEIDRKAFGPGSREVAEALGHYGELKRDQGDTKTAETLQREALQLHRTLYGDDHDIVADDLSALGVLVHTNGDYRGAVALQDQALKIYQRALGEEHPKIAATLNNMGIALQSAGESARAEEVLRRAVAMDEKIYGPDHLDTIDSKNSLAETLRTEGKTADAEALLTRVIEIRRKRMPDSPFLADSLGALAIYKRLDQDWAGAERLDREALEIYRRSLGEKHMNFAYCLDNLGADRIGRRDFTGAEQFFRQSIAIFRGQEKPNLMELSYPLVRLAQVLLLEAQRTGARKGDISKLQEAEKAAREAWTIRRNALKPGNPTVQWSASLLGGALTELGRYDEAEPLLVESNRVLQPFKSEPFIGSELMRLAHFYQVSGRKPTAQSNP